jgi:SAM-dependent methyltransferase
MKRLGSRGRDSYETNAWNTHPCQKVSSLQKMKNPNFSKQDGTGYAYFGGSDKLEKVKNKTAARQLSFELLNPKLADPNFLVLIARRQILQAWLGELPDKGLRVLDVGGRVQPYRPLLKRPPEIYVAIDPVFEGMLDVLAVGEHLPLKSEEFDLVICTQVLNYASNPSQFIDEMFRVVRREGCLYLSVPAIFPRYHDDRWRFMPGGLEVLLSRFSKVEIAAEGNSISGLFRTLNLFFDVAVECGAAGKLRRLLYTFVNASGVCLSRLGTNNRFSTNYICRAFK